jgi:hypothetical protein
MERAITFLRFEPENHLLSNSSSNNTDIGLPTWSGFVFLLGSSFFYGSNYIPVKQYETGENSYSMKKKLSYYVIN